MLNGAFETGVEIEYADKAKKIPNKATIQALAAKHIERYQGRIKSAGKGRTVMGAEVNVGQTKHYLGLWTGMRAKSYDYTKFNKAEIGELMDAVQDELAS